VKLGCVPDTTYFKPAHAGHNVHVGDDPDGLL